MTQASGDGLSTLAGLPTTRSASCPFAPPAELAGLREQRPISRMFFPDGHLGWLVSGYAMARAVLSDSRFSARYDLQHLPVPGAPEGTMPLAPPGDLSGLDGAEHMRYRRLLAGKFTTRRMRLLEQRIGEMTAQQLEAMHRQATEPEDRQRTQGDHGWPVVDLVEHFAQPVPALVICEILGVPNADREMFQQHAMTLTNANTEPEKQFEAFTAIGSYLGELIAGKRAEPDDDVLSDLAGTDLTDEELAGIGTFLLGAGLDTTANMIALSVFALLVHPGRLAALRAELAADPRSAERVTEELLRYLSVAHTVIRAATEDIELGGCLIRAGETVVVSIQAANRDESAFGDAGTLDVRRSGAAGHLAFGHGAHQCLGQQLARAELRVAIPALITRFPGLRLAVPADHVPLRSGPLDVYGPVSLSVTWV